jgi:HlyD family secretion protein
VRVLLLAVLAATAACFEFGEKKEPEKKAAAAEPALVRPATLRRRDLDRTLEISGEVEALVRTEVAAKIGGLPIVALAADLGSVVAEGDVLAKLDDVDARRETEEAVLAEREAAARVREAKVGLDELEAQLRGQEAAIAQAAKAFERAKAQAEKGALAAETLDNAQYKLEQERSIKERNLFQRDKAKVSLELLERAAEKAALQRKKAEENLGRTIVRAPFAGVVSERTARLGALAQTGASLFQLFDPRSLAATAQVTQRDLPFVRPGQAVDIRSDAYPSERFAGSVATVAPTVDRAAGTVPLIIALADASKLKPGLFVAGRILLERRPDVLVVPKKAILYERERPLVFKIVPGAEGGVTVRRVFFREGLTDREDVEALFDAGAESLAPGDRIVLVGQDRLRDGDPVALEPTPAESRATSGPTGG